MSVYLIVILGSMLGAWLLNAVVGTLNLRALDPEVPREFADVADADEYARSQAYTRATARFGQLTESLSLVAMTAFILLGGFPLADHLARAAGFGAVGTGLVFFALLMALNEICGLPFSIYRTFVIEERFGFNRTTPATFVIDRIKGWALTAVIGGPLLAMVLWFFQSQGPGGWVWVWLGVTLFTLALQYVAPVWILPLFNRFTPLPEGELRESIEALAHEQGFTLSGLFLMDGSRRSAKSNAFFTGFGAKKRIALFDTLVEQMSPAEITAVVAHEVGHWKRGHILRMTAMGIAKTGLVLFLMSLFLETRGLFTAVGLAEPSVHAGLVLFMLLYTPLALVLGIAAQALSRRHEYEADAFAAEATGEPEALVRALKTLSLANLSNLTPHPAYVFVHYSHPPVLARIKALSGLKAH